MLITNISLLDVMKKTHSNSNNQAKQNVASYVLDTNPFDVEKLTELINLGNASCGNEKASDILKNYLMVSEDNTLFSAYFEIIEQYNKLFGFLKDFGYTIDDFKAEMETKAKEAKAQNKDKVEDENMQLDN